MDLQIEVELQFKVDYEFIDSLRRHAEFVGKVDNADDYYDYDDFCLMLADDFLRKRNGKFELKASTRHTGQICAQSHDEITDEEKICRNLGIDSLKNLGKYRIKRKFSIITMRQNYRYLGFNIAVDFSKMGDLEYNLVEIEKMVHSPEDVIKANSDILAFAQEHHLESGITLGKLKFFIKYKNPKLFQKMVDRGIIKIKENE